MTCQPPLRRPPPPSGRTAKAALCALLMGSSLANFAAGQVGADLATQEVQRRQVLVAAQNQRLEEAAALLKDGKTQEALVIFEDSFAALPDVPLARDARDRALQGYLAAGINRANELAAAGDLAAANALLDKLDAATVAPGDKRVARARARLADPDRFPRALTAAHVDRVAEVKRLLILANSQREIGDYDKALSTYDEVLRLDAYNTAARRGMEHTEQERMRYFDAARDHRRSQMLSDVDKLWESTVPPATDISKMFGSATAASQVVPRGGREAIQRKLSELIIDRVDFSGATVEEVLEFLRIRSRDLDPEGRGIDFVLSLPPDAAARTISLNLNRVPVEEVLRYVTQLTGLRYRVEEFAVRLMSSADTAGDLITKSYRVPPDFISNAAVDAAGTAPVDPFAQTAAPATGGALNMRRLGAKEFLESRGVTFPEGASANFNSASSMLMVRNTGRNIELIDMLVEQALGSGVKQVIVEVRALDVSSNKLQELGFDWLLGQFNFNSFALGGGVIGNAQQANFLTQFPQQLAGAPVGRYPVTAGLRSSGDLVSNQTIEDVLYGSTAPDTRRSPGVLSLAGVLTNPQFQVVVRALDQKDGLDLVAQPSVVTKSGQRATVQIVREMIYPTEFDPPQIPTNFATPPDVIIIGAPTTPPPPVVTPATPTAFEMRRVGVVLEVEPVISDDGRTVDLTLTPEITDFVGFVNYGSPIRGFYNTGGIPRFEELTENRIFQPIFSTRKLATSVKVWDGATVVLGGLISDNNIIIEDKIPIIGDVPFLGRMFRSDVKRRRMKNMLIFVTTRVIDPSGSRIHADGP